MYDGNDIETIRSILKENKSIAVVGLSAIGIDRVFLHQNMQQKAIK